MTAMMIEAALRALVFAIAVGAGLRLLRVSNVPTQKAAWSFVLIASFAMPFLMRWPAAASWTPPACAGRLGLQLRGRAAGAASHRRLAALAIRAGELHRIAHKH